MYLGPQTFLLGGSFDTALLCVRRTTTCNISQIHAAQEMGDSHNIYLSTCTWTLFNRDVPHNPLLQVSAHRAIWLQQCLTRLAFHLIRFVSQHSSL